MLLRQHDIYQQLMRARDYIDTYYDQPLDLEQIAQEANFSRYHFLRLFRDAFNQTPHQYLVERRIERAKNLLVDGELNVTEVCFAVGFQSVGSFSTLFRRESGYPPHHYRPNVFRSIYLPRRYVPLCFLHLHNTLVSP